MTPKEKARYIYFKYYGEITLSKSKAKQCALLAVDMIIDNFPYEFWDEYLLENIKYVREVKQEIEKL